MLCDDLVLRTGSWAGTSYLRSIFDLPLPDSMLALRLIRGAVAPETVRLALDSSATSLIEDLTKAGAELYASRRELHLPYGRFWVEFPRQGGRIGFFVCSDMNGSGRSGRRGTIGAAFNRPDDCIDLATFSFDLDSTQIIDGLPADVSEAKCRELYGQIGGTLLAFCAMMQTPRLIEREAPVLDRLNRARQKRRKNPILDHSIIRLSRTAARDHADTQATASGGSMRSFHHVRAFRRIRCGKVEFVRPHTRGSRDVGEKRHIRVVGGHP